MWGDREPKNVINFETHIFASEPKFGLGGSLKMSKAKFLNIIQLLCLPLKNNGTVSRSLCLVVQKYMYKCLYKCDMNDFVVKVKPGTH